MGWRAALAMRYAEASQDNRVKELKESDIGVERVATIVESILDCQCQALEIIVEQSIYLKRPRILQPRL
jgi:hypothetical protein